MARRRVKSKVCRDCSRRKPIRGFYVKERRPTATRYFSRCKRCYYAWLRARAAGRAGTLTAPRPS